MPHNSLIPHCPTSFEIDEDGDLRTSFDGRNNSHTNFLHDLYRLAKVSSDSYSTYFSLVGKLGLDLVDDIKWKEVVFETPTFDVQSGGKIVSRQRQRTLIIPIIHVGKSRLSPNQLSEGTFRTLALLLYILTDKGGLLIVEEPEVCIHHGLLNSVLEVIKIVLMKSR